MERKKEGEEYDRDLKTNSEAEERERGLREMGHIQSLPVTLGYANMQIGEAMQIKIVHEDEDIIVCSCGQSRRVQ